MSVQAPHNDRYAYRLDSYRTLITVTGIMTKPTEARATAPVRRLAAWDMRGRCDEEEEEEEEEVDVRGFTGSKTSSESFGGFPSSN